MNKHKLRVAAILVSVVLCFFVISPMLIQGTSAYIIGQSHICRANFGQSHICRANFYAEQQESSIPESSVSESSVESPPTGDGLDIMPVMVMLLFSMITIAAMRFSVEHSQQHHDTEN